MVKIKSEWTLNEVINYWKCNNCGNTWVDQRQYLPDVCPECKSNDSFYEELTVDEVKNIEQTIDGKPLWVADDFDENAIIDTLLDIADKAFVLAGYRIVEQERERYVQEGHIIIWDKATDKHFEIKIVESRS